MTQGVKGHGLRSSIKGSSKLFKVPFTALCIHIPIQILFKMTDRFLDEKSHRKLFIWNRGQMSRSKVLKCVMALSLVEKYIYPFLCIMSILICLWWKKKLQLDNLTCIQIQILDFQVKVQFKISLTRAYDPMFYNQTHRDQI